jgi:hypothetical protein
MPHCTTCLLTHELVENIHSFGEVGCTILSVDPASDLPVEADGESIQTAISRSKFRVRFDEGILIDGSDVKVISGWYVSRIKGRY